MGPKTLGPNILGPRKLFAKKIKLLRQILRLSAIDFLVSVGKPWVGRCRSLAKSVNSEKFVKSEILGILRITSVTNSYKVFFLSAMLAWRPADHIVHRDIFTPKAILLELDKKLDLANQLYNIMVRPGSV